MSSRIKGEAVNLGESYIINIEDENFYKNSKTRLLAEENKKKAMSIIDEAQLEAADIIKQAKQKAEEEALAASEAIKEEAQKFGYKEGYEAGYKDGQDSIHKELEEKITSIDNFIKTTFDVKKRIIKSAHMDMLKLIVQISDKICHKKLNIDEAVLFNIIEKSVSMLKEKETITIIVNPYCREKIVEIIGQLREKDKLISNFKIIEDSSVSKDGAIVESVQCRVDSRICSQIDELSQKLFDELQLISEDELVEKSIEILEIQEPQAELPPVIIEDNENDDNF